MAFCTNCGKQIEEGIVCSECQPKVAPQVAAPQVAAPQNQNAGDANKAQMTMESIQKNIKEGFGKVTSSSVFQYYKKRLFNTDARQDDDNFKLSLYGIIAFYGALLLTLLIRGMDILLGLGGVFARMAGQSFGMDEAKSFIEMMKYTGGAPGGVIFTIALNILITAAIGGGLALVFYKLDKSKTMQDFVCAYGNRLVLATLLILVTFLFSLLFRVFSIGTGFSAILFLIALFLNSMAGLTLTIGETNVGGKIKFYVYSAAVFLQFVVMIFVTNAMTKGMQVF